MRKNNEIRDSRAEDIAVLHLLSSHNVGLQFDPRRKFDFIAYNEKRPELRCGIEVKRLERTKTELQTYARNVAKRFAGSEIPVILMFVDEMKINGGYFSVVEPDAPRDLKPLNHKNFSRELEHVLAITSTNGKALDH